MKARSTKTLEHRGADSWGDGSFGASRGGGKRSHKGIDYCIDPGDEVLAPSKGTVTKLGYPYAKKPSDKTTYRYVEITDYSGFRHRVFYIDPVVNTGLHIEEGSVIGIAQDIAAKYSTPHKVMKNHCHYEILDLSGNPVNPEPSPEAA